MGDNSTGSKQGTISSFFKPSPKNPTKLASSSSGKAKNSPRAGQEKRNNEKRSADNEELDCSKSPIFPKDRR